MNSEAEDIHRRVLAGLITSLFGKEIISNLVRPAYVERMIQLLLGPGWKHVGSDWAGWDIEGPAPVKIKVEVKQAAARQTWSDRQSLKEKVGTGYKIRFSKGVFDIAPRTGYFTKGGMSWTSLSPPSRPANIYIFAWQGKTDKSTTDHRDVTQWTFFVVRTEDLPPSKTISLKKLRGIAKEIPYHQLRDSVLKIVKKRPFD